MAAKRTDKKIKETGDGVDSDIGIKLHKNNCDKLYRWSMWRMYLNEELSRVISARRGHWDRSSTLYSVTSPYLKHPEGKKYGRQMKNMFKSSVQVSHSVEILPDNEYLVFGLPRVSLKKHPHNDILKLHESFQEIEPLEKQRLQEAEEAERQITKLFDFAISEVTKTESKLLETSISTSKDVDKSAESQERKPNGVVADAKDSKTDINLTRSEKGIPLVSKSRLFWEKLANNKNEIIELGKEKPEKKTNHEHAEISGEILQKQQKLLKKTIHQRTSKDLWRTLREKKTEILQMREMMSQNNVHPHNAAPVTKKQDSKTSQLWGFIFHKKKELLQMKRGDEVSHEVSKATQAHDKKKNQYSGANKTETNVAPRNFEDSFQKELAEKLRKRRSQLTSTSSDVE